MNKKFLFIYLLILASWSSALAQDDFWEGVDTVNKPVPYGEYMDAVFGTLDTNFYPSGILYDRVPGNTFISSFSGWPSDSVMTWDKWFRIYNEMIYASRKKPAYPEFIQLYDTCFRQYALSNIVNLGVLHFSYHKLREGALDSGWVRLQNERLYDNPGRTVNPYTAKRIFALLPLIDTLRRKEVRFILDEDYFYSNDPDRIQFTEANFGDGSGMHIIYPGQEIAILYPDDGSQSLYFRVHFQSGKILSNKAAIEIVTAETIAERKGDTFLNAPAPDLEFTIYVPKDDSCEPMLMDYINGGGSYIFSFAKVGLWYNTCFSRRKVRKPVIFVEGYDPTSNILLGLGNNIANAYAYHNDKDENGHHLLDALRAEGHDIFIIDDKNGGDCVENYAHLIEGLIKIINGDFDPNVHIEPLLTNSSLYENTTGSELIVVGYSLGAVASRYALAEMEQKHAEDPYNNPHHRVKKWVSFEGEHQGANVQLGMQYYYSCLVVPTVGALLTLMTGSFVTAIVGAHHFDQSLLGSNTAKEFVVYHRSQNLPNTLFFSVAGAPGSHHMRTNLLNKFASLNTGGNNPNPGYPVFPRLISVSNGSGNASPQGYGGPYGAIQPGEDLFNLHTTQVFPLFNIRYGIKYKALRNIPNDPLFGIFLEQKFWWENTWRTLAFAGVSADNPKEYDNAPGSKVSQTLLHNWNCKLFNNLPSILFTGNCSAETFCPTVSAHDLKDGNGNPQGFDYNFQNSNLLYIKINDPEPSREFGYPHIMNSSNNKLITPFDAIYTSQTNDEHVKDQTLKIQDFILQEMSPVNLELQNRTIGANEEYKADFEARNSITSGNNVETDFQRDPVGDFIIGSEAIVNFRAGDRIVLQSGFEVRQGAYFHAYTEPYSCSPFPLSRVMAQNDTSETRDMIREDLFAKGNPRIYGNENKNERNDEFINIYPNPSEGIITIDVYHDENNPDGSVTITVLDIMGKAILENKSEKHTVVVDLSSFPKGLYLARINTGNIIHTKKFIYK